MLATLRIVLSAVKVACLSSRGLRDIIIIIIIIIINCKWAIARWQWLLCMYINMK